MADAWKFSFGTLNFDDLLDKDESTSPKKNPSPKKPPRPTSASAQFGDDIDDILTAIDPFAVSVSGSIQFGKPVAHEDLLADINFEESTTNNCNTELDKILAEMCAESTNKSAEVAYDRSDYQDVFSNLITSADEPMSQENVEVASTSTEKPKKSTTRKESAPKKCNRKFVKKLAPGIKSIRETIDGMVEDLLAIKFQNQRTMYKNHLQHEHGFYNGQWEDPTPPDGLMKSIIHPPAARDSVLPLCNFAPIYKPCPLPFLIDKRTKEWSTKDLNRLAFCIRGSICHRQMFRMESTFQTKFLSMGFSVSDLHEVSCLHLKYDRQLRKEILKHYLSKSTKPPEKCLQLLENAFAEEKKLFEGIIKTHLRNKDPIKPYVIRPGKEEGENYIERRIEIMHMITWKQQEMKATYLQSFNRDEKIDEKLIDWGMVAKDMNEQSTRKTTEESLKKVYEFNISEKYRNEKPTEKELKQMTGLIRKKLPQEVTWPKIAETLKTGRSPVLAYHTYLHHCKPKIGYELFESDQKKEFLDYALRRYPHFGQACLDLMEDDFDLGINLKVLMLNWRSYNPSYTEQTLSLTDDALLIVAMVQRKNHLLKDDNFSDIERILPWRYCTRWRTRANALFQRELSRWTIEEDRLLLDIVKKHGIHYKFLQDHFTDRSRAACISRHKLLLTKLEGLTLEEYYLRYSRRALVVRSKDKRLLEIANLLASVIFQKLKIKNNQSFPTALHGILNNVFKPRKMIPSIEELDAVGENWTKEKLIQDLNPVTEDPKYSTDSPDDMELKTLLGQRHSFAYRSPSPEELLKYLQTFDTQQLLSGVLFITSYLRRYRREGEFRAFYENISKEKLLKASLAAKEKQLLAIKEGEKICLSDLQQPPYSFHDLDRRKFDMTNPASVASALQLRGMELIVKTPEEMAALSEWEKFIYQAYRVLNSSWKTKRRIVRNGIPNETELSLIPYLKRIVIPYKKLIEKPPPPQERVLLPKRGFENISTEISSEVCVPKRQKTCEMISLPNGQEVEANQNVIDAMKRVENRWLAYPEHIDSNQQRRPVKKTFVRKQRKAAAKIRWENQKLRTENGNKEVVEFTLQLN